MDKPSENMSFEETVQYLHGFPATWYPALLRAMVEAAYKKKVFVPGGASTLISMHEKHIGHEKRE